MAYWLVQFSFYELMNTLCICITGFVNQLSLPWVSYIVMMFWDIEVPSSKSLPPSKQDPIFDLHWVLNRHSSFFSVNFLVPPSLCIAYVPLPSSIFKCVNGHPPLQARGKKSEISRLRENRKCKIIAVISRQKCWTSRSEYEISLLFRGNDCKKSQCCRGEVCSFHKTCDCSFQR